MNVLTRQDILTQLHAAMVGKLTEQQLAAWAFEQFYAEEAGRLEFEPGYRQIIGAVLDELMFGDAESFRLKNEDFQRLREQLEQAEAQPADEEEQDDWEDDDA